MNDGSGPEQVRVKYEKSLLNVADAKRQRFPSGERTSHDKHFSEL